MTDRKRARELARQAAVRGDTVAWFETLYDEAGRGQAVVPWADLVPNPHLVAWLEAQASHSGRALDVGCGYGDNSDALANAGYEVSAFDVAASAVARAEQRFADRAVFSVHDARALPEAWRGHFDLVSEVYTLQALPTSVRAQVRRCIASCVAVGGTLLLVARGRDDGEPSELPPWPLTRGELDAVLELPEGPRFERVAFEDFMDGEEPPVRRFVASYRRTA